jgi:CheY-like chemotaxis protein
MPTPPKVLVVEDSAATRTLLRCTLEPEFAVDEVATGTAAIQAYHAGNYDVILLDLALAGDGPDGFDVCRAIREHCGGERVKIVVCSGSGGAAGQAQALYAGADSYVRKPFSPMALLDVLRRLVGELVG